MVPFLQLYFWGWNCIWETVKTEACCFDYSKRLNGNLDTENLVKRFWHDLSFENNKNKWNPCWTHGPMNHCSSSFYFQMKQKKNAEVLDFATFRIFKYRQPKIKNTIRSMNFVFTQRIQQKSYPKTVRKSMYTVICGKSNLKKVLWLHPVRGGCGIAHDVFYRFCYLLCLVFSGLLACFTWTMWSPLTQKLFVV